MEYHETQFCNYWQSIVRLFMLQYYFPSLSVKKNVLVITRNWMYRFSHYCRVIVELINEILTHFMSLVTFYNPWEIRKPLISKRHRKRSVPWNSLKNYRIWENRRKTPVLESLLNKVAGPRPATWLKGDSNVGVFLWNLWNF